MNKVSAAGFIVAIVGSLFAGIILAPKDTTLAFIAATIVLMGYLIVDLLGQIVEKLK